MYDRERVLDMWAEGRSVSEIAEACGYADTKSVIQVAGRARKKGDPRAMRKQRKDWRRGQFCERYWKTVKLRKIGLTESEICERLGLSVYGVRNHIARAKLRGHLPNYRLTPDSRARLMNWNSIHTKLERDAA